MLSQPPAPAYRLVFIFRGGAYILAFINPNELESTPLHLNISG